LFLTHFNLHGARKEALLWGVVRTDSRRVLAVGNPDAVPQISRRGDSMNEVEHVLRAALGEFPVGSGVAELVGVAKHGEGIVRVVALHEIADGYAVLREQFILRGAEQRER